MLTNKGRSAAAAFLVEGPHAVGEALNAPGCRVRELFVTDAAADRELDLIRLAARTDAVVRVVTERVLDRLAQTVTPQGVVAVVDAPTSTLADAVTTQSRLVVVLAGVADPGNAGTVIRTADAAGADAVVLTAGSTDVLAGKAVRASAGSLFHLPVVTGVTVADGLREVRRAGCAVLAAAADGQDDLDELAAAGALAGPIAWVFGSEAHGLPAEVLSTADRTVRIPIHGRAESLNLSAAAAVCLFATARAQRAAERH